MEGPDVEDQDIQGMIPRCIQTVFDAIDSADEQSTFSIKCLTLKFIWKKLETYWIQQETT